MQKTAWQYRKHKASRTAEYDMDTVDAWCAMYKKCDKTHPPIVYQASHSTHRRDVDGIGDNGAVS